MLCCETIVLFLYANDFRAVTVPIATAAALINPAHAAGAENSAVPSVRSHHQMRSSARLLPPVRSSASSALMSLTERVKSKTWALSAMRSRWVDLPYAEADQRNLSVACSKHRVEVRHAHVFG